MASVLGLATLYAINPPWWTEPIYALRIFFGSNLGRAVTVPIKTLFLGQVISTPDGSLPWYNTLVWTVFVTPVGFLALALMGVGRALRRWRAEPFGLLAIGHWAFLLLLRALPHVPGHDGVRQFLPAFGVLALVAGLGAASLIERIGCWGRALVAAALIEGAVSVALIMPVPLSYYSPIVGGLPGAARLGMEPTYYWDSLSGEALDWLKAHTPPGQKVRFATYPSTFLYLSQTGQLPASWLRPTEPSGWTWYVLQNRPGAFRPNDRALAAHGRPAFVVRKWGVPLLWVFPYEQVEAPLVPAMKTPRPTTARSIRAAAGRGLSAWKRGRLRSLTRGVSLARGLGRSILGSSVDDRGRSRGRFANRSRRTGGLLVTKTAAAEQLLVAAAAEVLEQAALRSRGASRLANRSRRSTNRRRRRTSNRLTGRSAALLHVTGIGVGNHEGAEDAGQGQSQQVSSHLKFSEKP